MAQDDYVIANASGATVRGDINNQLAAIVSNNSGATAPATTFAHMWWYDTTDDALKQRNAANTAWLTVITFDQTGGLLRWDFDKGADIASAATTDIGAATGNSVTITGTVTITALGTIKAGVMRLVTFAGALTLTHNATSLILPSGADITTAAGDLMLAESLGSGNWRVAFFPASGRPVIPPLALETVIATTSGINHDFTNLPADAVEITATLSDVSTNGTSIYEMQLGDSGGIETTGYVGFAFRAQTGTVAGASWPTDAANLNTAPSAAQAYSGAITLTLVDPATNTWAIEGSISDGPSQNNVTSGRKSLTGVLDRIRFSTAANDTYDGGKINLLVKRQ